MTSRSAPRCRSRLAVALSAAIIVGLMVPAFAVAAELVSDSYSEAYRQSELDVTPWDPTGQTFTAGVGGTLDSCKFLLRRVGPVAGSVYAKLWAHIGDFGVSGVATGTALATSAAVDVSTLSDSWALVTFTFDNTVPVVEGTPYVITVEYPTGSDGTLYLGLDWGGSMLHPGTGIYSAGGDWWVGTADVPFYVYVTSYAPEATDLCQFTEAAAASGELLGVGKGKAATGKLAAFIGSLQNAKSLIEQVRYADALAQLESEYKKCDGSKKPGDAVTGPARVEVAARTLALIDLMKAEMP